MAADVTPQKDTVLPLMGDHSPGSQYCTLPVFITSQLHVLLNVLPDVRTCDSLGEKKVSSSPKNRFIHKHPLFQQSITIILLSLNDATFTSDLAESLDAS